MSSHSEFLQNPVDSQVSVSRVSSAAPSSRIPAVVAIRNVGILCHQKSFRTRQRGIRAFSVQFDASGRSFSCSWIFSDIMARHRSSRNKDSAERYRPYWYSPIASSDKPAVISSSHPHPWTVGQDIEVFWNSYWYANRKQRKTCSQVQNECCKTSSLTSCLAATLFWTVLPLRHLLLLQLAAVHCQVGFDYHLQSINAGGQPK